MARIRAGLMAACAALSLAHGARANTEPAALYDTRSASMGGTGTAAVTSGAAFYHNPAALDDTRRFTGTATFTPLINRVSAPWGLAQRDSTNQLGPMPMLGAGLRLHDRFVLGLGGMLLAGAGAKYEKVPELGGADATMAAVAAEFQVPFSVRILKGLSVGAGYRLTYAHLITRVPMPNPVDPTLGLITPDVSMSGVNPLGLQIGVLGKPLPGLRLGLSYRSKVTVDIEGDAKIDGMPTQTQESEFAVPHKFAAGAALSVLEDMLVLAADVKYWMYADSHQATATNGLAADWRDSVSLNLGGEYLVLPMLPVRAGFLVLTQATTREAAIAFMPPPGMLYGVTAGAGLRAQAVEIDVGGGYQWGSDEVSADDANPAAGVLPGEYAFRSIMFSASATVRL